jgi:hypothetical protein
MENLNELATKFNKQLPESIRIYLNRRKINNELISDFEIGYAIGINGFNWITIPIKNEKGECLFFKLRRDPADEETNPNKYIFYPAGNESGLFNSKVILNSPYVVICEGEFDCIVLYSQGVNAISSTAGAMTFKNEWVELLQDKEEVVICFDYDKTGKDGAKKLADKLGKSLDCRISIIDLPAEVGEGGDITTYFSKLVAIAPARFNIDSFMESKIEYLPFNLITAHEIYNLEFDLSQKWLIEGMLANSGVMMLSGNAKSYKTWIVIYFASCVAVGKPIFGRFDTKQGGILIVNEENSASLLCERLRKMNIDNKNIYFSNLMGLKVDKKDDIMKITQIIKRYGIRLVIFDNFVRMHSREENSASEMREIFEGIKPILATGASIIFTHHHRKETGFGNGQSLRGSTEISAFISSHFLIEKKSGGMAIVIKNVLMRDDKELDDLVVAISIDKDYANFSLLEGQAAFEIKAEGAKKEIVDLLNEAKEPASFEEIKEKLKTKIGDSKLRSILSSLVIDKTISEKALEHNKKMYFVPNM